MDLTHAFGHDGFHAMVFCRSGQGNYDHVQSKVNGLGFMDASTCIYMYCNIEKNIMKNQFGSPDFGIQGKIFVYIHFMFILSPLFIFYF